MRLLFTYLFVIKRFGFLFNLFSFFLVPLVNENRRLVLIRQSMKNSRETFQHVTIFKKRLIATFDEWFYGKQKTLLLVILLLTYTNINIHIHTLKKRLIKSVKKLAIW
ncbi:unnamed protein product [Heterobilharzia americana]|nr:unnamed protein product [Heterobilharzia americana]